MNSLFVCLFIYFNITSAIKVTIMPSFGYSHTKVGAMLGQELSRRGHNVTLIQINSTSTWENITTYTVISALEENVVSKYKIQQGQFSSLKSFQMIIDVFNIMLEIRQFCFDIIDDTTAMKILSETDLIIGEVGFHAEYFAKYFKKPIIGFQHLPTKLLTSLLRLPASELYVPAYNTLHTENMSVSQKIVQYFLHHIICNMLLFAYKQHYKTVRDRLNIADSSIGINLSLILLQYDPLLEYPQPLHSHMFAVGPWTTEPGKSLPGALEEFVSSSKNGFILVSFGTIYGLSSKDANAIDMLVNGLSGLDYKVILACTTWTKPTPSNLLIMKFAPQNDLLAHPKIKLFVTHAGMLSVHESCYHGVPVLVVPRSLDQRDNGFHLTQRLKMGIMIEFNPLNFNTWSVIIPKLIQNKEYKKHAMRCSKLIKNEPQINARGKAADIVEKFVRWDYNASHLRPYVLDMPWYEYYLLDVLMTMVILPILVIIIASKCCKRFG